MTEFGSLHNTELDLAEALRWCWRHYASIDFNYDDDDNCPVIILTTPLRHPEGDLDRASSRCSAQTHVEDLIIEMVSLARERLNLE